MVKFLLTFAAALAAACPSSMAQESQSPWTQAMFGADEAVVDGNGRVDNEIPDEKGNVRSNWVVKMTGNATVVGDLLSGVRIERTGQNTTATGIENPNAGMLTYPSLVPLVAYRSVVNDNHLIGKTSEGTSPLSGQKFKLQNKEGITLQPGKYYFTDFSMLGECELKLTGATTIYMSGKVEVTGKAKLNVDGSPCRLHIISSSDSPSKAMWFSGQSVTKAMLYALRSEVQLNLNSEVFGAVIAKRAKVAGNAVLHYVKCGRALEEVPTNPPPMPNPDPNNPPPTPGGELPIDPIGIIIGRPPTPGTQPNPGLPTQPPSNPVGSIKPPLPKLPPLNPKLPPIPPCPNSVPQRIGR